MALSNLLLSLTIHKEVIVHVGFVSVEDSRRFRPPIVKVVVSISLYYE